ALVEAVERIEDAYSRFPELDTERPRSALVAELRTLLDDAAPALPALMACAALDPAANSPSVGDVLRALADDVDDAALARVCTVLGRRRRFSCAEIAPVLDALCRQNRFSAALTLIEAALGDLDATPEAAAALGSVLHT